MLEVKLVRRVLPVLLVRILLEHFLEKKDTLMRKMRVWSRKSEWSSYPIL